MTCDPQDDTIDHFENTYVGIAKRVSKTNFDHFEPFYKSLLLLKDLDEKLFLSLKDDEREAMETIL